MKSILGFFLVCCLISTPVWSQEEEDLPSEDAALAGDLTRQAEAAIPEEGDAQLRCVQYHRRGMANFRLGRYEQAAADLRQALALNVPGRKTPNLWGNRWRIQVNLSTAYANAGDHFGQITLISQMADEQRGLNPRRYFFTQLFAIGPYGALLMFREADAAYQRAGAILPELKQARSWNTEAENILNQYAQYGAYLQEIRGNAVEAERLRREALRHATAYREFRVGASDPDHQMVAAARSVEVRAMNQLAHNLATQNKLGEAEYYARLALTSSLGDSAWKTRGVSLILSNLAFIKLQQGQLKQSERYYNKAVEALEASEVKPWSTNLAALRAKQGFILSAQQRWQEADAVFRLRDAGLRSSAEQYKKFSSRNLDWALVLTHQGAAAQAAEMLTHLIAHRRKAAFSDPNEVAQMTGYLGVALTAMGQTDRALAAYREALPALLKQSGEDGGYENGGYFRLYRLRMVLEGYLDLMARVQAEGRAIAGLDPVAEAFSMADVARGSSVQRAVVASAARASLSDPGLADLARREQDTTARIHSMSKLLVRLASAPEEQRLGKIMSDMQRDLQKLESEQVALRQDLAQRFPEYADLINPKPATPDALRKVLRPGEAALSFYLAENQTYLWLVTAQSVQFRVIPYRWSDAIADTAAIRRGLDLSDGEVRPFDLNTAAKLYRQFLANDAAALSEIKVLNVIPHGPLSSVPFSVLLTDTPHKGNLASQPWLMQKYALAQQASASALIALRRTSPGANREYSFLGFGDPSFQDSDTRAATGKIRNLRIAGSDRMRDTELQSVGTAKPEAGAGTLRNVFSLLSPLPDTAIELAEIAGSVKADPAKDVYLGKRATEGKLKKLDLSRYRIIAFATHGLVPGELPNLDQPALALANPVISGDSGNDGLLTLEEVLALKLDADWVVLSACNTASADGESAEAISGLGRGFFYAGARSLLVSNWAVETVSARMLTTGLFRQQMLKPQFSRAEALRESMRAVMSDASGSYAHPAFWAPFSLVGDGMR